MIAANIGLYFLEVPWIPPLGARNDISAMVILVTLVALLDSLLYSLDPDRIMAVFRGDVGVHTWVESAKTLSGAVAAARLATG